MFKQKQCLAPKGEVTMNNNPPANINTMPLRKTKANITQFILNLLYASLILSALIGIGAILFGNDEYGGNAFETIALLIAADVVLLLGLITKIPAFRYTVWGSTVLAFAFTVLSIWTPRLGIEYQHDKYDYVYWENPPKVLTDYFSDLGLAFWMITATLLMLSIISLAIPLINKLNNFSIALYWIIYPVAIVGTLPLATAAATSMTTNPDYSIYLKIYLSAFILNTTIFIILGISLLYKVITDNTKKTQLNNVNSGNSYQSNVNNKQSNNTNRVSSQNYQPSTSPAGNNHPQQTSVRENFNNPPAQQPQQAPENQQPRENPGELPKLM